MMHAYVDHALASMATCVLVTFELPGVIDSEVFCHEGTEGMSEHASV